MNKNLKEKTIICPVCSGAGLQKGYACKNCSGMGICTFEHGRFFYWGLKLGKSVIDLDHIRHTFFKIVKFFCIIIGLIGALSIAYWFYLLGSVEIIGLDFEPLYFWKDKNILALIFWLSVINDMFLVYLISEDIRKTKRIDAINYDERLNINKSPNNWEELKSFNKKFKIDVVSGFGLRSFAIIEEAYLLAYKLKHVQVEPLHLFFAALKDKEVIAVFSRLNVDAKALFDRIKNQLSKLPTASGHIILSNDTKEALIGAFLEAHDFGQKKVTPKNILSSAVLGSEIVNEIVYDLDITVEKINNVVSWFVVNEMMVESYQEYKKAARFKPGSNMDRAYTSIATPILNSYAYDLTLAAKYGKLDFCVSRDEEILSIFQTFESGYNGTILVGQVGSGRSSIVNGIAQLMVKEDVPSFFQDKRLLEVDLARLAGGVSPEQAEANMLSIISEVNQAGNIILFFKGVDAIVGITSGDEGSLDLAGILASAVEKKHIYCITSVSTVNYLKYIEDSRLGNVMQKIEIKEPEGNKLIQIVESKITYLEAKYKVYFSYNAIERVIEFSKKYIYDKYFPKKAIDVLEMVAVKVSKLKGPQSVVNKEDIAVVVSEITGIPLTQVTESESKNLLNMETEIHKRMIGQEEAVKMLSASLRRARTELREGNRPIANFLFLGPTGVGKTELAKTVSEVYFGDENYMIRVDMSEYQHVDSVKKMIGDASGTKGYLTEKVRKSPFSLVLLDEIEKAHPDILNLFLQVMDDGRLTDGSGKTIDFTNSIVIATSNAGAVYIQEEVKKNTAIEEIKEELVNTHLTKVMRPELVNRFDGVVVFKPLDIYNVIDIARLMLAKLEKMLDAKGIKMKVSDEGLQVIARQGFDPKFGARPLRRVMQDNIENKIANTILAGDLRRRDTVIINGAGYIEIEKGEAL